MIKQNLLIPVLWVILAGVVVAVSLVMAQPVSAQQPAPSPQPGETAAALPAVNLVSDNDVNRVAKQLYCPVCPNTPLDVCTTQACKDWRAQIREQMASGWTDQQVMYYFVKQYGERVLAEPERGGFTSLVWMLPFLVVLLGLILVWLMLKSWRSSRGERPTEIRQAAHISPAVPQDVLANIEAEIRKMD